MAAALEGGEWLAAAPGRNLHPGSIGTHFTEGWVDFREGLEEWKVSSPSGLEPQPV